MPVPKMSILLPTVRPEGLAMVDACLSRQTFQDWEWIIATPERMVHCIKPNKPNIRVIAEPPKREGDFYALNKAWNVLIREAQCELLVFAVDWIWFENDALERFWKHFQINPNVGINSLGDHFRIVDTRIPGQHKPQVFWCGDKRVEQLAQMDPDRWDGCDPNLWEAAFCSMSKSALIGVGGFDEVYDTVAANSEKEAALRMYMAGYRFQLDSGILIRNYTHPKKSTVKQWDEAYDKSCRLYRDHQQQIASGERKWAVNSLASTPPMVRPTFYLHKAADEIIEGLTKRLHERGHDVHISVGEPKYVPCKSDIVWLAADADGEAELRAADHRAVLRIGVMPKDVWDRCVSLLTTVAYDYFKGIVKSEHRGKEYRHINHFIFGHKGEQESREAWLNVGPGDVFLDIGSALGSWSLPAAACGATVYAFDPGTDAGMLAKHVKMNGFDGRIEIFPKLVSDCGGVLVPRAEIPWHSVPAEGEIYDTETITIDWFVSYHKISRVDFIKIDVDGSEMAVLRGAEATIRKFKPKMVVEIHDFLGVSSDEVTACIVSLGYSCEVVAKEAGFYHHVYCVPLVSQ